MFQHPVGGLACRGEQGRHGLTGADASQGLGGHAPMRWEALAQDGEQARKGSAIAPEADGVQRGLADNTVGIGERRAHDRTSRRRGDPRRGPDRLQPGLRGLMV